MSVTERSAGPPPGPQTSLSGWGGTTTSRCRLLGARDSNDVIRILASDETARAGLIARGAGRSYGDAALNDGGDVLDMTSCNRIVSIDRDRRLVVAQGGVTVAQLQAALSRERLTLPVVPGTGHVTLGGAIASDVHGKNHHHDGALARHVLAISLCTPAEGLLEVSPESDRELFYATLGGMGLTGVIAQATLRVEPLPSGWVAEDIDRTDDLDQTLAAMAGDDGRRYSVAWLDLLAGGAGNGRAVISRADPLPASAAPPSGRREDARALERRVRAGRSLGVPRGLPSVLRAGRVRDFNALRWRRAPRRVRGRPQKLARYLFPLDSLERWNRLYGPAGLIQYQFVVPDGQEAALMRCFAIVRERRLPVYLAVFKRFGEAFGGPLSFPLAGWTLAIDIPAGAAGLHEALASLDDVVAGCGGRVYLTKDARMSADALRAMYPQLDRFAAQRERADPAGVLRSDLARRLELC